MVPLLGFYSILTRGINEIPAGVKTYAGRVFLFIWTL